MLFISKLDGKLSCSEHDPCGPEPLEPGEIREYVPDRNSLGPAVSMVPDSRRSSFSPMTPSAGQAVAEVRGPPPRLYINTKTATSSFIPFNRSYLTDRTEGRAFSSASSTKEEGEVEDGEVCRLEVEDVEDDDEEDDDEEAEEDEDDMEEMEIVEDEEEEEYGRDLPEEHDGKEDSEGGNVFYGWSDSADEDVDDGEVEGEDWGRFEGEDK